VTITGHLDWLPERLCHIPQGRGL